MDIIVSPRAYFKALEDLAKMWQCRRPHPLGLTGAAETAALLTGLLWIG